MGNTCFVAKLVQRLKIAFKAKFSTYNQSQNISDKLSLSCETAHCGKISAFQEIFTSTGKILISGGELSTGQ